MRDKKTIAASALVLLIFLCISAALFYFQLPNMMIARCYEWRGIDVSHYQGDIDWDSIKKQGIKFVYIKATEGSSYVDECYELNSNKAAAEGLTIGFYHFFSFESSGISQAENYIATVGELNGKLIPAVDVEFYGSQRNPDRETVNKELSDMLEYLETYYGRKPIIYSTQSFYNAYLKNGYEDYPLWIRNVYLPPAQDWTIWQYSDRLRLYGMQGQEKFTDGNVMRGDISNMGLPVE